MKPSGQRHRIQPTRQAVIPAASRVVCSFVDPHGGTVCGRSSFRTYVDATGVERGFCAWVAGHAWSTMQQFPPAPLGDPLRAAHQQDGRTAAA